MKDQLISFEVAKLAKEKGFDIYCERIFYYSIYNGKLTWTSEITSKYYTQTNSKYVYQPTQSLLQKWLREEKGINVLIGRGNYFNWWKCEIHKITEDRSEYLKGVMEKNNYEEALEAGLKEALKLLTNKPSKG